MIKILKRLGKKEWILIALSLCFIVGQVWLELTMPDYMSEITKKIKDPDSVIGDILKSGSLMLACAIGSTVFAVLTGYIAARVGASFSKKMRSELFNRVDSFSMEEINRFSTASLITRSTNDVNQVQMFVVIALQMLIKAPITAVWAIIKISGKGTEWTIATAVAVIFLMSVVICIMAYCVPKFKKMQILTDNVNKVTRENLTGVRVVRAYNAEDFQQEKFEKANEELTATTLPTSRIMSLLNPFMNFVMTGLTLSVYWIGAILLSKAAMFDKVEIYSNMITFSAYAMQVIFSFIMLVMMFVFMPRATVSAKRINEVLDTKPTILSGEVTQGIEEAKGEVIFENVSFKYPDAAEYVIKNINFKVKQGETIAFIGSTGSGKSTLINLVPRFFDATEGNIYIGGINIKDYKLETLYNKIGYVPQKAVLFRGTINSNVAYGDNGQENYGEAEIKKAIAIAQGTDFVEKMEGQYDADIAQGGTNISGGQKQRLAIARAICRKPEIYIFDDSFSALDYKTDRLLRSVLKEETAGVTSMIVAQRIGTIMDADQIIVLDQGEIVGVGKHKELLRNCTIYKQIAMSQLSEEELSI